MKAQDKTKEQLIEEVSDLRRRIVELETARAGRDQVEEELHNSETRFRVLVEHIPAITYTAALDEASTTLYVSPQVKNILGYSQEEFRADPDMWRKTLHPDDRQRVLSAVARSHSNGKPFISEYRMISREGGTVWLRDEAAVVHDRAESPLFIQGVMLDITERRLAEEALQKAHSQMELRVAERTFELAASNKRMSEEIEERRQLEQAMRETSEKLKLFAYSVVHDLRSPTVGIYGLTKLLLRHCNDLLSEQGRTYCEQILKVSEHLAGLVDKINVYIRVKEAPLEVENIQVNEILQMVRDEFSTRLSPRQIRWVEPEVKMEVKADRFALLRAFRNFVENALKYGGESLSEIRIGYEESETFQIFSVADDGQGIKGDGSEKIFNLFQRSRASNDIPGTGLGLAIVKEIAERHRGRVWVESGLAGGTTFYMAIAKDL